MDSDVKVVMRNVYTVEAMMSAVGGFMSIAFIIGLVFI